MADTRKDTENVTTIPFEIFFLQSLYAENIISKTVFDLTYDDLQKELNKTNRRTEICQ